MTDSFDAANRLGCDADGLGSVSDPALMDSEARPPDRVGAGETVWTLWTLVRPVGGEQDRVGAL